MINMAGDRTARKSENVDNNSDKSPDNIECYLNLSLDEAFSDSVEYVPCPEFQFAVSENIFFFYIIQLRCSHVAVITDSRRLVNNTQYLIKTYENERKLNNYYQCNVHFFSEHFNVIISIVPFVLQRKEFNKRNRKTNSLLTF